MNSPHSIFSILALGLAVALTAHPAQAQTRVGEAAMVKNEVLRIAAATTPINVGDALLRDETVRTGLESAARLVMADSTNLSLGPNASLKLDRTVFDDEHHYRDVAIRLTSGAFRFVTGHRTRPPTRSRRRLRRSAFAAPCSISCHSAARPPWCCRRAHRRCVPRTGSASI